VPEQLLERKQLVLVGRTWWGKWDVSEAAAARPGSRKARKRRGKPVSLFQTSSVLLPSFPFVFKIETNKLKCINNIYRI
jgi:hypothetical protein